MALLGILGTIAQKFSMNETTLLVLLLAFFLILANYVFETIKNTIFVGIFSAAFPFFAVPLFGLNLEITLNSILYFVLLGTGLYHVYELLKLAGRSSSFLADVLHGIILPFVWIWRLVKKLLGIK